MTDYLHIAAITFRGLFWAIVIIATIVAQIVKAAKKGSPSKTNLSTDQQTRTKDFTAPDDELQQFLKSLTSQAPPAPGPATPPPQTRPATAARQTTPPARMEFKRKTIAPTYRPAAARPVRTAPPPPMSRVRKSKPKTAYQPARPVTATVQAPRHVPRQKPAAQAYKPQIKTRATPRRAALIKGLKERRSVRKAIVLREILGPPIAMHH